MSELDEIRRRKLEDLKRSQSQKSNHEQKIDQQIEQLESMVKPLFTKDALTRYGTIKAAYPDRAVQVLLVLAQAAKKGQVSQVDDKLLKDILLQLTPKQRETKIRGI
ncbi:MAG TPA: DNA-binding protein [Candidatus Nanoarchaeia archaeon]|nr:DNA-binding protein [Candidatus Nanoarchaeia archaeon]